MKRTSRVLAILLALAMLLSVTAFAAANTSWLMYGGDLNHTSNVSGAPTSITKEINVTLTGGSGWDGVDNVPVMQTVGNKTYAYVLFDGRGTNGAQVVKYNCTDEEIVWTTTAYGNEDTSLNAKSGFQLSTPCLDETNGMLYVGVISQYDDYVGGEWLTGTGSKILALTDLDSATPTVITLKTTIPGQINTPIVQYGDYIYFGTWTGSAGGTYYQLSLDGEVSNEYAYDSGFYWAGAVKVGNYIYFGSDNGVLHYRSIDNFAGVGGTVTLPESDAGNVRSSISTDGSNNLYFTTQGVYNSTTKAQNGYLWCYEANTTTGAPTHKWHIQLDGKSTSTPTIVIDDTTTSIYTGYYTGFDDGGVQVTTYPNGTTPANFDIDTVAYGFPVQCSILYSDGYVYFNTNSSTGAGYCYPASAREQSNEQFTWRTTTRTYALGGMACANGIIVFGNDYNELFIVK